MMKLPKEGICFKCGKKLEDGASLCYWCARKSEMKADKEYGDY